MQIIPVTDTLHETASLDERILELVESIRSHRQRISSLEAKNDAAREELRQLLELRGENWADDEGYARLVPDSTRVSYETIALDELIIHEPLHYGWLKDYRKEAQIRSSVQVK